MDKDWIEFENGKPSPQLEVRSYRPALSAAADCPPVAATACFSDKPQPLTHCVLGGDQMMYVVCAKYQAEAQHNGKQGQNKLIEWQDEPPPAWNDKVNAPAATLSFFLRDLRRHEERDDTSSS